MKGQEWLLEGPLTLERRSSANWLSASSGFSPEVWWFQRLPNPVLDNSIPLLRTELTSRFPNKCKICNLTCELFPTALARRALHTTHYCL